MVDWHHVFTGKRDPNPPPEWDIYSAFGKYIAPPIAMGLMAWMIVYKSAEAISLWWQELPNTTKTTYFLSFFAVVGLIVFFKFRKILAHRALLTPEGDFNIDIQEDLTPGRGYKCSLIVDVKIPLNDWVKIENAGLGEYALCTFPAYTDDPGYSQIVQAPFKAIWLKNEPMRIDFQNLPQMRAAKQMLEHFPLDVDRYPYPARRK